MPAMGILVRFGNKAVEQVLPGGLKQYGKLPENRFVVTQFNRVAKILIVFGVSDTEHSILY